MSRFGAIPAPPAGCVAYQNLGEFSKLWEFVAEHPHGTVVEIGSLFGGTLWYWSWLPGIQHLVSVDLVTGWDKIAADVRSARRQWGSWFTPRVPFTDIAGDSRDDKVREAVMSTTDDGLIDFLFIDGNHSYEGVKADWINWSPHVRSGGVVAFHDTWPNFDRHEPGVVKWVDELRRHLPTIEWTDPDGVGIAVVVMP